MKSIIYLLSVSYLLSHYVCFSQLEITEEQEMVPGVTYSFNLNSGKKVIIQPKLEGQIFVHYVDDNFIAGSFLYSQDEILSNYELEYRDENGDLVENPNHLATRVQNSKLATQIMRETDDASRTVFMDTNGDFFPDTRIIHFFESKRERVKNKIKYHIDGICHTTETEHGDKDKAKALGQSLTTE